MTLCRLLVGITDILDVPRSFLEEAASRSSSLQLCYELLGTHEIVRLENPFKERNTDGSVGSDVVESTSLPLVIPVRSLRSVHALRLFSCLDIFSFIFFFFVFRLLPVSCFCFCSDDQHLITRRLNLTKC